ncbi:MAG TPA: hypothetical protein VFP25_01285 [Nitrososphaeraceae archaeon]|nr:hypothetical protein [Nitrososphaeraceae archaeon]
MNKMYITSITGYNSLFLYRIIPGHQKITFKLDSNGGRVTLNWQSQSR